ncbi:MAG TPA: hypothetical protein VGS09_10070 [Actinomycetota bacterium]|nr:hypothetical protein [Actinomycetota bacterium]
MPRFDPHRILRELHDEGVKFVVIGGIGAAALGSPSLTDDLDICYERSRENLERLSRVLFRLGAKLRGAPDDIPFKPDAPTLATGDHFTFVTDAGDFDCLGTPSGSRGYADLVERASLVDMDGVDALVASVDDLIRMKQAAGRPKDLIEVEVLGALRDELDRRKEEPGQPAV